MRKIIVLSFLFLSVLSVQAQELEWHTDISDAAKESLKTKKPLMLFFTGSDWCGWCKRLQKEVFQTPEFKKWAKKNVVLVELDYPKRTPQEQALREQNFNLQQMFGVTGYPTIWFVQPEKKEGKKVNLNPLGNTGYVAGGPTKWLEVADGLIEDKK
ncbi:thioredoxin family protein [Flavobacterium sp. NRK F10]|uniref:thioredoxin family protein n=1 Tax=Flavobacterium sp. NRK F10 TaxID=2954931 RepID=UPI002091DF6F|nr:thioredoxin family protein [Flavobacterium sp. NRK F10]MCO6174503.1 thioredoxin family protein [Flavobacterium sp. NRK F10]